jgi:hypothetical protein
MIRKVIRKRKTLWLFLMGISLAIASLVGGFQSRGQVPQSQDQEANKKAMAKGAQGPVVDFVQTIDPADLSKRRARGAKHDKSQWHVHPDDPAQTTTLVDTVDPNLPAFPVTESSAVILGDISDARTYLSNDKTGVYTEFTVRIKEIFKDPLGSLTTDGTLEISREGGRVRFPSGRVHLYTVSEETMPRVGGVYVLFLTGNQEHGFSILTGYELQAGKIIPLDNLPQTRTHKNNDETIFLDQLRIKTTASMPLR